MSLYTLTVLVGIYVLENPFKRSVGNPTKSGMGGTEERGASNITGHAAAYTHGFRFQTGDGSVSNINRDARPELDSKLMSNS